MIKIPSQTERKIAAHKGECTCLAFSPLGDAIVSGGADCVVKLWNVSNGKELANLKQFRRPIIDVSISIDNELLIASSTGKEELTSRS